MLLLYFLQNCKHMFLLKVTEETIQCLGPQSSLQEVGTK